MQNHDKFYNSDKQTALTFLEFGSINLEQGTKTIWDFRMHQEAYDFFMLARYFKEFKAFKESIQLLDAGDFKSFVQLYQSAVHTKDYLNTIATWSALTILDRHQDSPASFFELGSTIFGCIEAHETWRAICRKGPGVDQLKYCGLEISELLGFAGELIHPNHHIKTIYQPADLFETYDLFFGKGVSLLYGIGNMETFADYLERSKLAVFDYSFSLANVQSQVLNGAGKLVHYLPYSEFHRLQGKQKLFIRKSDANIMADKQRARCAFVWGEEELVRSFLDEFHVQLTMLKEKVDQEQFALLTNGYFEDPRSDYADACGMLLPLCRE